jgi:hypothetical protein
MFGPTLAKSARLRSVRRPKTGARYIGKHGVIGRRHLRNRVDGLRSVGGAEDAVSRIIKKRALLNIVGPIGDPNRVASLAIGFNGILIDRRIDHTQIVQDSGRLGAFAGAQKSRHRNGRQQRDDGDNDHYLDEGEPFVRLYGQFHNEERNKANVMPSHR